MDTSQIVTFVLGLFGFVFSLVLTGVLIFLGRKPLAKALEYLFGDSPVARYGLLVILVLLGLVGLRAAFGAFYPGEFNYLLFINDKFQVGEFTGFMFYGLLNLLSGFAEVFKWAILIAAIFFVGYSLRSDKKK
jgi:hypothetical protein